MSEFSIDKWFTMTLSQQLGNVGSDYERALKWKKKGNDTMFQNAARRTLEQIDMTLADDRLRGRRKEVARVREAVCDELFSSVINQESAARLANYFMYLARSTRL